MASFDIVSEVNLQEVDNAVNQAKKEISSRYDFRGSKAHYEWDKKDLALVGDDDYKMDAMKDVLQKKLHHRGVDIAAFEFEKPTPMTGSMMKQKVSIAQGIDRDQAKKLIKDIKDSKLKVQAQIQEDKVRVTSKSIDTLQECMALVKSKDYGIPLQFENLRS